MTTVLVRKKLTCFLVCMNSSSSVYKSHVSISHYFSTCSKRQQLVASPTVNEFLIQKHHFSPKAASRVASALTHIKNPEKSDSILSFLKESGFSSTQLEKLVIFRPDILSSSLEKTIKPKIKIFHDLGFSANDTAVVISTHPAILKYSVDNRVIPSLSVLKGLLQSNEEMSKLLRKCGWFLSKDLEKEMVPNIEFLKSCGITMEQIIWVMYNLPRFLLHSPEYMKKFVNKVDEMGVSRDSRMFIHALRVVSTISYETWELKLKAFRKLGFSENDIVVAFRKAPFIFGSSEKKMKEVIKVLLATGKYDMSCIIRNPTSFSRSIEKNFKPRLHVLQILESENLIQNWPSLSSLCTMSVKKFFDRFVGPYLDKVGHVNYVHGEELLGAKKEVKQI